MSQQRPLPTKPPLHLKKKTTKKPNSVTVRFSQCSQTFNSGKTFWGNRSPWRTGVAKHNRLGNSVTRDTDSPKMRLID